MSGRDLQGFCGRLLYYCSKLALGIASSLEELLQLPEVWDKISEWDKKFTSLLHGLSSEPKLVHPQKKYLQAPGSLSKISYIN